MAKLNEYLHITRGNEQMLLNLEAEIDDFLDLLNALRGRGFKFRVIGELSCAGQNDCDTTKLSN